MTAPRTIGLLWGSLMVAQACGASGVPVDPDRPASDAGSDAVRVGVDASTGSPSVDDTTDATDASADSADQNADAAKTDVPATAARCMTGGNVLYVDGDPTDPVHPGQETFAGATTTMVTAAPTTSSFSTRVWVEFVPTTAQGTGKPWELIFSTDKLSSPIGPGVYPSAQRHISGASGHPGLLVSDYATSCSGALTGSFDIVELKMNGTDVASFTATFEQQCAGASGALRGCVHVGP